MPKNPGRVCTHCTKRLTAPCDGSNSSCPYINSKRRNLRYTKAVIALFILIAMWCISCTPDNYEQIQPVQCDRDTGYVIIFNRWANVPDDTIPVIRIKGTFYENACEAGIQRKLLPVSPVIKYWKDVNAAKKFEHCQEK